MTILTKPFETIGLLTKRNRRWGAALVAAGVMLPSAVLAEFQTNFPPVNSFAGSYLAARNADQNRDLSAAANYYSQALRRDPDDIVLREQTFLLLLADGRVDDAVEFAEDLLAEGISTHYVMAAIGADAISEQRYSDAIDLLQNPQSGPLPALTIGVMRAWALAGDGQASEALRAIDDLATDPTSPTWFTPFTAYHAGLIAAYDGRLPLARNYLSDAYSTENGSVWYRVATAYAEVLSLLGERELALDVIQDAVETFGDRALLEDVRKRVETDTVGVVTAANPESGSAEIFYNTGLAVRRDTTDQLSLIYLRLALHMNPDLHIAWLFLANYFEQNERFERVIDMADRIPDTSPLYPEAAVRVGYAKNALDRFDDAINHLNAIHEALPNNLQVVTALGEVLRLRERYEEAGKIYSDGLAITSDDDQDRWRLYFLRGITYERTGRWPEAEADFRRSLALRPNVASVLNYLGYSLVDRGMKYEEALGMIEQAVELRPQDGAIVDSLGWAYYKLGRYEDAVRELERAVELEPNDAVINDHLGDAYWKVGRRLEATFQWSHALDMDPEADLLVQIEQKLASGLIEDATDQADAGETTTD